MRIYCIPSRSAGLVGGRRHAVYPCKYHRSDISNHLHLLHFPTSLLSFLFFFLLLLLPAFSPTSIHGNQCSRTGVVWWGLSRRQAITPSMEKGISEVFSEDEMLIETVWFFESCFLIFFENVVATWNTPRELLFIRTVTR